MTSMTGNERETFRRMQADLARFRSAHTMDLSMDDLRLICDMLGDANLLLKRYAPGTLPGGI